MNLLESLLSSENSDGLRQIASQFGLDESAARNLVGQLTPKLSRGIKHNTETDAGLSALDQALARGSHQQYLKDPARLTSAAGIADGNAILGHILGSKDVSRNVAANAAQATGIDSGIVKKILPMVATAAMGMLSKERSSEATAGSSSDTRGLLDAFLGADDDNKLDDVLDLARKLF